MVSAVANGTVLLEEVEEVVTARQAVQLDTTNCLCVPPLVGGPCPRPALRHFTSVLRLLCTNMLLSLMLLGPSRALCSRMLVA